MATTKIPDRESRPRAKPIVGRAQTAGKLFFSISEAADLLAVAPHVLRYWETQFRMLRPKKGRSGSRMYQQRDIELLRTIRALLYDDGLTIAGARRKILEGRRAERGGVELPTDESRQAEEMERIRRDLREIAAALRRPPRGPGSADGRG